MLNLNVVLEGEIRGKEKKVSSKGTDYIIVRVEDERGVVNELCDKDMENFDHYAKGKMAKFYLHIEAGKYTNVSVTKVELL